MCNANVLTNFESQYRVFLSATAATFLHTQTILNAILFFYYFFLYYNVYRNKWWRVTPRGYDGPIILELKSTSFSKIIRSNSNKKAHIKVNNCLKYYFRFTYTTTERRWRSEVETYNTKCWYGGTCSKTRLKYVPTEIIVTVKNIVLIFV